MQVDITGEVLTFTSLLMNVHKGGGDYLKGGVSVGYFSCDGPLLVACGDPLCLRSSHAYDQPANMFADKFSAYGRSEFS